MNLMEDATPLDLSGIDFAREVREEQATYRTMIMPCEAKIAEASGGRIEPNEPNKRTKG
jgi:hypothetical protein